MGMFDFVVCHKRLPVKRESFVRRYGNPFQTKDLKTWEFLKDIADEHGALQVTISPEGLLLDHLGHKIQFNGTVEFYGEAGSKWYEFSASVSDGVVKCIKQIEL